MTILEAMIDLLEYFTGNDSFSFEDDYETLVKISGLKKDEERRHAAFHGALELIVDQGVLRKVAMKKKTLWILTEKLKGRNLQITLSYESGIFIAKTINDFCKANDLERAECNPNAISEIDINFMAILIKNSMNDEEELEEGEEENDEE